MTMATPAEILEHQRRLHALQDAHGTALGMETRDPLCAGEEFPIRCGWGRGVGSLQRSRVALCNSSNETSTMEQKIHLPSHLRAYTCWTVCFILALTLLHSSLIPGQMQKPQPNPTHHLHAGPCWGPGDPPLIPLLGKCLSITGLGNLPLSALSCAINPSFYIHRTDMKQ